MVAAYLLFAASVAAQGIRWDLPSRVWDMQDGMNVEINGGTETIYQAADYGGADRAIVDETPFTLYVSSSDAGDDQALYVTGIDPNFASLRGEVTLNGTSAVQVGPGEWLRFNRAHILDGETSPAGTVYFHTNPSPTGGAPGAPVTELRSVLVPGHGETAQAMLTVADQYTYQLQQVCVTASRNTTDPGDILVATLFVRFGGVGDPRLQDNFIVQGKTYCKTYVPALIYPSRSVLELVGRSKGSGSKLAVSGSIAGTFTKGLLPLAGQQSSSGARDF